jgi:hypothetical protein
MHGHREQTTSSFDTNQALVALVADAVPRAERLERVRKPPVRTENSALPLQNWKKERVWLIVC